MVVALTDDLAVAYDDGADERIGTRAAGRARGEPERPAHVRDVGVLVHGW